MIWTLVTLKKKLLLKWMVTERGMLRLLLRDRKLGRGKRLGSRLGLEKKLRLRAGPWVRKTGNSSDSFWRLEIL
jgi:hypothetical protein